MHLSTNPPLSAWLYPQSNCVWKQIVVTRGGLYSWAAYHSGGTLERGDRLRKVSFYYYSDLTCLVSTRASIFAFSPHTCCGDCLAAFPLLNLYREKSNVNSVLNLEGGNNTCHRPKRARSAGTVLPEWWPGSESLYCSLRLLICFVSQSLLYLQNDTSICMP